jgi:hypothetical protein
MDIVENHAVAIARIAQAQQKDAVIVDSIKTLKPLLHNALVTEKRLEETLSKCKANHR